jgi:hypothetical protein
MSHQPSAGSPQPFTYIQSNHTNTNTNNHEGRLASRSLRCLGLGLCTQSLWCPHQPRIIIIIVSFAGTENLLLSLFCFDLLCFDLGSSS